MQASWLGFVSIALKAAMKYNVAAEPPVLKSLVDDALRLEKNNLKDDFFGFSAYVAEQTEICELFYPLRSVPRVPKRTLSGRIPSNQRTPELLHHPVRDLWKRKRPSNYRFASTRSASLSTFSRNA